MTKDQQIAALKEEVQTLQQQLAQKENCPTCDDLQERNQSLVEQLLEAQGVIELLSSGESQAAAPVADTLEFSVGDDLYRLLAQPGERLIIPTVGELLASDVPANEDACRYLIAKQSPIVEKL